MLHKHNDDVKKNYWQSMILNELWILLENNNSMRHSRRDRPAVFPLSAFSAPLCETKIPGITRVNIKTSPLSWKNLEILKNAAVEVDSYKLFLDWNPFQGFLNPSEMDGNQFKMNESEVKDVRIEKKCIAGTQKSITEHSK